MGWKNSCWRCCWKPTVMLSLCLESTPFLLELTLVAYESTRPQDLKNYSLCSKIESVQIFFESTHLHASLLLMCQSWLLFTRSWLLLAKHEKTHFLKYFGLQLAEIFSMGYFFNLNMWKDLHIFLKYMISIIYTQYFGIIKINLRVNN